MIQESPKEKILIVDDLPDIIKAVTGSLRNEYDVISATSGKDALTMLDDELPDLILLDIMMPEMDGYELCRKLKEDERTRPIPVIFVTARSDIEDEERGLALGAVDYLTKPVSPTILKARIRTHLELKRHRDRCEQAVKAHSTELEKTLRLLKAKEESDFRQAAQVHSGRLEALGEMATSMAHEINQPLNVISITVQGWQLMQRRGLLTTDKVLGDIGLLVDNVNRISRLIDHVRTLGHISQDICHIHLDDVLEDALSLCRMQFLNVGIPIELDVVTDLPPVKAVESELTQVILNLLSNSKYVLTERKKKTMNGFQPRIRISTYEKQGHVCLAVEDNGGGVEPLAEENIFAPFFTTKPAGVGTGLGLSISRKLITKFDGDLVLKNTPGLGACFEISLPAAAAL